MNFREDKKMKKIGIWTGYIVMYLIFTTILYFLLKILNKIPENWNYFYILLITLSIVLFGTLIKILLK